MMRSCTASSCCASVTMNWWSSCGKENGTWKLPQQQESIGKLQLSHCVGKSDRYWERIEQQEAYILFLRKTAEIDKPYYTLEVEPNGTIRQKRTYFDRQNDDLKDAEMFLKEWQKVVSERLTESDREKAEKSKILRLQEFEQLRQDDVRIHVGDLAGQRLVDVLVSDLMETAA